MILIVLGIIAYLVQMGMAISFICDGTFRSRKELKMFLIPYPYWIGVGLIWLTKYIISQYKRLE